MLKSAKLLMAFLGVVMLASCVSRYQEMPSQNSSFRVKSLILHFTAVDYETSVSLLVDKGYVSSHYLIPKLNDPSYPHNDIRVFKLVDETERAWHAGVSAWQGRTGLNDTSIGIEIVNQPNCEDFVEGMHTIRFAGNQHCEFFDFEEAQIEVLIELIQDILKLNPDIEPTAIVAHSDIAPGRKNDPGPKFPWYRLYQAGIGAWYENDAFTQHWAIFSKGNASTHLLQRALKAYGYDIRVTGVFDRQTQNTIAAFQMHFLPWQVNGKHDYATSAAIFALLEKYFPERYASLWQAFEDESVKRLIELSQTQSIDHATNSHRDGNKGQLSFIAQSDEAASGLKRFFGYAGQGELIVESIGATHADIFINSEKLNITQPFSSSSERYNIYRRTRNGANFIEVKNIRPADGQLSVQVNYPTIQTNSESNNDLRQSVTSQQSEELVDIQVAAIREGKLIASNSELRIDNLRSDLSFASMLSLLSLHSQGLIDFDHMLSEYLPELASSDVRYLSIYDVFHHNKRIGLSDNFWPDDIPPQDKVLNEQNIDVIYQYLRSGVIGETILKPISSVKSRLLNYSVELRPDLRAQITEPQLTINDLIIGILTERLSGRPWNDFLSDTIPKQLLSNQLSIEHPLFASAITYSDQATTNHKEASLSARDFLILAQTILNQGGYGDYAVFDAVSIYGLIKTPLESKRISMDALDRQFEFLELPLSPFELSSKMSSLLSSDAFSITLGKNTVLVIAPSDQIALLVQVPRESGDTPALLNQNQRQNQAIIESVKSVLLKNK